MQIALPFLNDEPIGTLEQLTALLPLLKKLET